MTKLKLKFARNEETLSRAEMKQVFGGYMSGSDDTGSGCYWYRCLCSDPSSVVAAGSSIVIVKILSPKEYENKVKDACSAYNRADCVKDKPC